MPIRRRSTHKLVLALSMALIARPLAAQQTPSVSDGVASEGQAAMDALRQAMAGQKASQPAMTLPAFAAPKADASTQRRAWEAMRRQAGNPSMKARADASIARGKAGLAAQQEAMARRVGQALGLAQPDIVSLANVAAPDAHLRWVPLLFVSSSMPIDELRTYAAQLAKTGGALAFRGMPGGMSKVAPMAKLSAEILRLDPGCEGPACTMRAVPIVVDPIAFREHGITRVPALAMVVGDPTQAYCERGDTPTPAGPIAPAAPVVYGDAALSGLLEEIARLGGQEEVADAQARLAHR